MRSGPLQGRVFFLSFFCSITEAVAISARRMKDFAEPLKKILKEMNTGGSGRVG